MVMSSKVNLDCWQKARHNGELDYDPKDRAPARDSTQVKTSIEGLAASSRYARHGNWVIGVPSTVDQSPVRDRNL